MHARASSRLAAVCRSLRATRLRLLSSSPSSSSSPPPPPPPPAPPAALRGPVSWATVGLVVATGAAAVLYTNVTKHKKKAEAAARVESFGRPMLGGPWSLVDSEGLPTTSGDARLAGGFSLVYFGFTFCPDICPNELVKMSKVASLLDARLPAGARPLTPVFVTLDPYRDSCAQVGAYVRDFHPRMLGLTGTPAQVAKVAKAFRVYFAEVDHAPGEDDYLVDHSIVMYLVGPDGNFVDFYTQMSTASEIADKVEKAMRAAATSPGAGAVPA
jgi:protein SCO1/2